MALRVELERQAARRLRRLSGDDRGRILRRIRELADDPTGKHSEPLKGFPGHRRSRIGGWRIVYRWDTETLSIELIETRGQVYRDA